MNKCCEQTFIKALNEVLHTIKQLDIKDMSRLVETLQYAVESLKKEKKKDDD